MEAILHVLEEQDVPRAHVAIVDASADFELMSFLKKTFPNGEQLSFPLVKLGDTPIGGVEELAELVKDEERAATLLARAYSQEGELAVAEQAADPVYVGRGVLDSCLDAAEYVGHGVSSLLWLPVTLLTWPFSRSAPEIPKGPRDVDFEVVHTNWYWRNLKRRFRFADAHFYRIHPDHGDIRAAHLYASVESVTRTAPTALVLRYNDGSAPDELHALPNQCDEMIRLMVERALPHAITVKHVESEVPVEASAQEASAQEASAQEASAEGTQREEISQ